MNPSLLYAIGALSALVGWVLVLRSCQLGFSLLFGVEKVNHPRIKTALVQAVVAAGLFLLLSATVPMDLGRPAHPGWQIPLIWLHMHFFGWLALASAVMTSVRLVQAPMSLTDMERTGKLKAAGIWAVLLVVGLFMFQRADAQMNWFRGSIAMSPTALIALILLAVAAVALMVRAQRAVRSRGMAKAIVTHLVLMVGCVIFGLPFAWLVITSFKEDRDMAQAAGIVWVPRVQVTVPYDSPTRPLVSAVYEGRRVQAIIDVRTNLPNGNLTLEVDRPLSLRGRTFEAPRSEVEPMMGRANVVLADFNGTEVKAFVAQDFPDGTQTLQIMEPESKSGERFIVQPGTTEPYRVVGLRWQNYTESLEWLPAETMMGLTYLRNTLWLVITSVIGTVLSSSLVAYGFSRLRFPGRKAIFGVMLSTMMLPGAVTMLPTFLIFRQLGWIDTLLPLWVPTFFAGAFNVFLLRQFFSTIPMELEDAAKIDGCSYLRTYWQVMMPQIKPALTVIAIWTFMGQWNNFMGPLIYVSTPELMPIAYALQLFQSQRGGEFGLMMAFATMATIPVLLLFFFAQRYFIEGVQLSGLGGR